MGKVDKLCIPLYTLFVDFVAPVSLTKQPRLDAART